MVSGLSAGEYSVTIQTFNPYCYNRVTVTVTGGGGSPCDNQGGDSDGDGICDNQDNCKHTSNPDQADNDGDGIGNVCDDTPNGPCGNQGGDSDGDGVCDNQDNCKNTANPNQADNDGDGIGNVCDDTPNGPCGNQGGDSDGDGVCDNQDNCKHTPNPNQADNDGDGIGNVCDSTPNGTICSITRTVSNARECANHTSFGIYLYNQYYTISNGKFVEHSDGKAKLSGSTSLGTINITFYGRTTNPPGNAPVFNGCFGHQNTNDWYYYASFSGNIGNTSVQSSNSHPFQIGTNANNHQSGYGGSGWLSGGGDINILLNGNTGSLNVLSPATECPQSRNAAHLGMEAYKAQRQVALQWVTNTTYKNDYYVVEKSLDGDNFETLTRVENGVFNEEMESFLQKDGNPQMGMNYYRIKQVHFDGSFDFTDIQVINFNIDLEALEVYPNPVKYLTSINSVFYECLFPLYSL